MNTINRILILCTIFLISSCGCKDNRNMSITGQLLNKNTSQPLSNYYLYIKYIQAFSTGMGSCRQKERIRPFTIDQNGNFSYIFDISQYTNRGAYVIMDSNMTEIFTSVSDGNIGILKGE